MSTDGYIVLPKLAVASRWGTEASLTLPRLGVSGRGDSMANITLPLLGGTRVSLTGELSDSYIVVPAPEATGELVYVGLNADIEVPGTFVVAGKTGSQAELERAPFAVSATSTQTFTSSASITLPTRSLDWEFGYVAELERAPLSVSASSLAGEVSDVDAERPALAISATSTATMLLTANITIPARSVAASSLSGTISDGAVIMTARDATGTMKSGAFSSCAITLPMRDAGGTEYVHSGLAVAVTLPAFVVVANSYSGASRTYSTIAMNVENIANTELSNYVFNGYAVINDSLYACGPSGLYKITGTNDNGTAITAKFRTATLDFGTSRLKRMPDAFVGFEGTALSVKTLLDSGTTGTETVLSGLGAGLHSKRFKFDRGSRARYWAVEIANVAGSDFNVEELELLADVGNRRNG